MSLIFSGSPVQSQIADLLPCNDGEKSLLTYSLIQSLGLLSKFDYIIEKPWCTAKDINKFHSKAYTDILLDKFHNRNSVNIEENNNDDDADDPNYNEMAITYYTYMDSINENHDKKNPPYFKNKEDLINYIRETFHYFTNDGNELEKESVNRNEHGTRKDKYCNDTLIKYGLMYDCPIFKYLPIYCYIVTGATLEIVSEMIRISKHSRSFGKTNIGINWDGGRHHANRNKASGFCYVNDIVLAIQKFRRSSSFNKITYLDFDLHHGDGVENAFKISSNVQTISIHHADIGFFPGTGTETQKDIENQIYNFVLPSNTKDESLYAIVVDKIIPIINTFNPQILVILCGGDGLRNDDYNLWKLSIKGLTKCIMEVIKKFNETVEHCLLLGGGGYNNIDMAKFYSYLTYNVVKFVKPDHQVLDNEYEEELFTFIPEHAFLKNYSANYYRFFT
ncbi:histone deacetylase SCDLUD_000576 [Saccharomycodes ludwigii]|uniref:histone deacetylase n=1 Tax=Saccharomycodes ludwigii TaxID=36035 RepID=UPI001E889FE7|nr:hypothetical protein SCDLUD_000576 [Saccharomycodes ludwigii]KAH3902976.1 hypothetical protein SCDLUD_000576 [Saccharomycodes ludwigii]